MSQSTGLIPDLPFKRLELRETEINTTRDKKCSQALSQIESAPDLSRFCAENEATAHELTDMLSVIIGFAKVVHDELDEGSRHKKDLEEIIDVAERAAGSAKTLATRALDVISKDSGPLQ